MTARETGTVKKPETKISALPELDAPQAGTRYVLGAMTTIAPGLKKYVEREAPAGAPTPRFGSKVHVHFTATVRSRDEVVDSSRGEFTTEVGGVTVRKCNMPLALTLPMGDAARDEPDADARAPESSRAGPVESRRGEGDGTREGVADESMTETNNVFAKKASDEMKSDERTNVLGFVMGIMYMRLGERATFCADACLAYGERGKGAVGPNEAMDFDIELVGVDGDYFPARRKASS